MITKKQIQNAVKESSEMQRTIDAHWVCHECGTKHGRGYPKGHVATYHNGKCDICLKKKVVTEFRDYGYSKHYLNKNN